MTSKTVIFTLGALAVLGYGGYQGSIFLGRKKLNDDFVAATAEAKQLDIPLMMADLQAKYKVDKEKDLLPVLRNIGRAGNQVTRFDRQTRYVLDPAIFAASFAAVPSLADDYQKATDPTFKMGVGVWAQDSFGPFGAVKEAVKQLVLAGIGEARAGKWNVADRYFTIACDLYGLTNNPPFKVLAMETTETNHTISQGLVRILHEGKGSPASIAFAKKFLGKLPRLGDLRRTFDGDMVLNVGKVQQPAANEVGEDDESDPTLPMVYIPKDQWKRLRMQYDVVRSYIGIKKGLGDTDETAEQVDALIAAANQNAKIVDPRHNNFLPNVELMQQLADAYRSAMASKAVAMATVAVFEAKQAAGTWPEALPQYEGKPITDPYSKQDVRYRSAPDGFQVYVIGLNGQDDGGRSAVGWGRGDSRGNDDKAYRFGPGPWKE